MIVLPGLQIKSNISIQYPSDSLPKIIAHLRACVGPETGVKGKVYSPSRLSYQWMALGHLHFLEVSEAEIHPKSWHR